MEGNLEENPYVIRDLYSMLSQNMPCDQSKIFSVHYSRLKYADQYGSTMLELTIKLVNTTTGEDWTLLALAKILPKYTISHDITHVKAIFKNEVAIYVTARGAIDAFLKERGVRSGEDFFITNFGGRINLTGTSEIDHDAVLILKNLRAIGYKMAHRRTGFDLESAKAIIMTLAKFHGSTIGLKNTKPKEFKEKVRPYLGKFYTKVSFEKIARTHMIGVLKNEGFSHVVIDRAVATFDRNYSRNVREPWATFVHANVWVNKIFIKFDRNRRPQDVRFRGFQRNDYNSSLSDLLFFLFTSVQLVVLKEHLDSLIEFYHSSFLNMLSSIDVDTSAFSRPLFYQELKAAAPKGEFYKTVCMLYSILGTNLDMVDDDYMPDIKDPLHINRLCYLVREFDKRGWLY